MNIQNKEIIWVHSRNLKNISYTCMLTVVLKENIEYGKCSIIPHGLSSQIPFYELID